jgi:exodeoxyribonuclease VII small subunit
MVKKQFLYAEAISELEKILYKLENEEIDLDQLSENVKRASELISKCKDKLTSTENEVANIIKKINSAD